jgi:DNA-binding transcriptional ArsR family regulator
MDRLVMQEQFAYHRTMNVEPDLERLARTIGDPSRIRMLLLLMEGRALTAKELAYGVGVEPATATAHLRRLEDDGLLTVAAEGRHKYFRLASPAVAQLVESVMVLAPGRRAPRVMPSADLRTARFCYDHLAGRLGTRLTDAMVRAGVLAVDADAFTVTPGGEDRLAALGVDVASARRGRRLFAARCLDWSERTDHLAGSLGAALADRLVALGWVVRRRDSRAVAVTAEGVAALEREFGIRELSERGGQVTKSGS